MGGIALAHVLSDGGRIGGEMTITHLADDHFLPVVRGRRRTARPGPFDPGPRVEDEQVQVANVTDERGVLVLAGPQIAGCSC